MTVTLFAQPYDISAQGFYFETLDDCQAKAHALRNAHGDPVEEYELQFIDGEQIDCELAKAIGLNQANLAQYLGAIKTWDDHQKTAVIIAVGEGGYDFEPDCDPDSFDVSIYHVWNFTELAEQFVEEGLFGSIGDLPHQYIDFEAIGRDLAVDYCETRVAGETLIYRLG
jgi:antirestriction protein